MSFRATSYNSLQSPSSVEKILFAFFYFVLLASHLTANSLDWFPENNKKDFQKTYTILVLNDPQLPSLTQEQIEKALREAEKIIEQSFMLDGVKFKNIGQSDHASFFAKIKNLNQLQWNINTLNKDSFKISSKLEPPLQAFYSRYPLKDLIPFLNPKAREGVQTHYDFHRIALKTWENKFKTLRELKYKKQKILNDPLNPWNLSSNWIQLLLVQQEAFFILSNTLILYDDFDRPSPHVIFKHGKLGGYGLHSEKTGFPSILISTIGFSSLDVVGEVNPKHPQLSKILASYLIAHEFGHSILGLRDVYDHKISCLMNTPPESENYLQGYQNYLKDPSPCIDCRDDALRHQSFLALKLNQTSLSNQILSHISIEAQDEISLNYLGHIAQREGEEKEAEHYWRKSILKNPHQTHVYINLYHLLQKQQPTKALKLLTQAAEQPILNLKEGSQLAQLLVRENLFDHADNIWENLERHFQQHPDFFKHRVQYYFDAGDFDLSYELYKNAKTLSHDQQGYAAYASLKIGDSEQASIWSKDCLKHSPNHLYALITKLYLDRMQQESKDLLKLTLEKIQQQSPMYAQELSKAFKIKLDSTSTHLKQVIK